MNQVILIGRLTKDPEIKATQNGKEVCSFTVAVDRRFKNASGEREADFISCVAWEQRAKLLGQYCQKGSRIGIVGNIQTRSYDDKDGKKVYVTEVIVDQIEFVDTKNGDQKQEQKQEHQTYQSIDDEVALPFDL